MGGPEEACPRLFTTGEPGDPPCAGDCGPTSPSPPPSAGVRFDRDPEVVTRDLRGWGKSDGSPEPFGPTEGEDIHDAIEWAAQQPWSNGRIGMSGVSYLAIPQWSAAATKPPHLAAISPWEGFTDAYRDFSYPGGIRENGFMRVWSAWQKSLRPKSPSRGSTCPHWSAGASPTRVSTPVVRSRGSGGSVRHRSGCTPTEARNGRPTMTQTLSPPRRRSSTTSSAVTTQESSKPGGSHRGHADPKRRRSRLHG
ncbi:hypothetical protein B7R25_08990 [Subtercola boreus]|uniref:Xaa-Pro dipeptidyl-peptidase-like domain-containing protein n=1 Tax=Subtercola boreus TaxID=120213 RepID=A0A3E0WAI9_9MICO|nr:hypothetical protein B7R24_08925 [Subtercola boreus]RFA20750.1 hypothetical protein B7R23_08860 [Subtercola boreus]RFA26961.1 hypothetical protein B7R25_08990 [Subtercola boreus]